MILRPCLRCTQWCCPRALMRLYHHLVHTLVNKCLVDLCVECNKVRLGMWTCASNRAKRKRFAAATQLTKDELSSFIAQSIPNQVTLLDMFDLDMQSDSPHPDCSSLLPVTLDFLYCTTQFSIRSFTSTCTPTTTTINGKRLIHAFSCLDHQHRHFACKHMFAGLRHTQLPISIGSNSLPYLPPSPANDAAVSVPPVHSYNRP